MWALRSRCSQTFCNYAWRIGCEAVLDGLTSTLPTVTIRVLHLIKGLGPGGAEQLLVNQARATEADDLAFSVAYLVSCAAS